MTPTIRALISHMGCAGFVLFFSLSLVSCSKNKLPGIKDPETLRTDCAILYQEFPETVRTNVHIAYLRTIPNLIPQDKWTPAVLALKPAEVLRCRHGICILIGGNMVGGDTKGNAGYFVFCGGFLGPSGQSNDMGEYFENGLTYVKTNMKGIYEFPSAFTPTL